MEIPYIGVTGEYQSGKTLFGLLIDPTRTVHYDFEKSGVCYKSLGFLHVDFPAVMLQKFPQGRYRPLDVFVAWREHLRSLDKGRIRVMVLDDISSIELGLVEYVRKNPAEFGYSTQQFAKSEAMMWGAAKNCWKQTLLTAGIECCVMVAHTRQVFANGVPVKGQREAKGLDTIMELSTLYLKLDRSPDQQGRVPESPVGVCLKNRLSVFVQDEATGEMTPHPALPPRIVGCTPAKIRWWIEHPKDYSKLSKDELVIDKGLTDDEKLLIQSQIASDQARTAEAQVSAQALVNDAAEIRVAAMQARVAGGAGSAPDQSAQVQQHRDVRVVEQAQQQQQEQEAQTLREEPIATGVGDQEPSMGSGVAHAAAVHVSSEPLDLSKPHFVVAGKPGEPWQPQFVAPATPDLPDIDPAAGPRPDPVTVEQLGHLRDLKTSLGITAEQWGRMMQKRGVTTARNLTRKQAYEVIVAIEGLARQKQMEVELDAHAKTIETYKPSAPTPPPENNTAAPLVRAASPEEWADRAIKQNLASGHAAQLANMQAQGAM
jgi:hypothetical protein